MNNIAKGLNIQVSLCTVRNVPKSSICVGTGDVSALRMALAGTCARICAYVRACVWTGRAVSRARPDLAGQREDTFPTETED